MSVIIKSGDTNSLAHVETDGSVFVKVTGSVTPTGGATEAKQDLQNTKLDSIATKLDGIKVEVSMDTAGIDTRLDTLHADLVTVEGKQDTGNASLASIDTKVSTAAKQDTGNTSLGSIDTKLTSQATTANQASANTKLDTLHADNLVIEGKLDTVNTNLTTLDTDLKASQPRKMQDGAGNPLTSTLGALDVNIKSESIIINTDDLIPSSDGVMTYGFDGTNPQKIKVDVTGQPQTVVTASALPSGAATSAKQDTVDADLLAFKAANHTDILAIQTKQDTGNTSLASIDTKLSSQATAAGQTTMSGKLDTLHADLVTVEGKQDTGNASLGSIDTKLSSQATAAGQTTINSNLATIDSDIKASQPRKMQDGAGAALTSTLVGAKQSLDVNIAGGVTIDVQLSQTNDTVQIYGNDGTTNRAILTDATGKIQVGVTSSALPTGAATESTLSALNTKVTTTANGIKVDGSAVTQPVSGSVSVSNFPATQPVSGTVTANIGTTNGLALDSTVAKDSSLTTLNTSVNSLLKPASTLAAVTTLGSITNTVTIKADTPVNQANALKVDGSAITQPISAVALPLPSGAATSALQTSGNASLSSIDSKTPALGQALAAASVPVVLTAAQLNTLTPLTAVTANIGTTGGLALDSTVAKDATLTNGTQKSVLRSATKGTTSAADVTSTNFDANTQALDVSIKGTVSTTLSGTPAVSVSNFPAVQAVSQSSKVVNSTVIGTFTASDAVVAAPIGDGTLVSGASTAGSIISLVVPNGYQSWTLLIKGYVSGTIYTESSSNSTNGTDGDWIDIKGRRTGTTPGVESVTYAQVANGYYRGNASGFTYFRCRLIGATGPLVNISLADSTGAVFLNSGIPTGGSVIGKVSIDQTTPGTTNLVQVSNFPAVQAVSATSLPLPTGAATAANQATMNTSLGSIDTKLTSQATAANQATMNTSLSSIDTKTPALVGGRQPVESSGNVASGTADSGNPIKVSGVYNAIPPNLATGQRGDLQVTPNGRLITVVEDGAKSTYSAAVQGLNIANSATDIFTITGSATKTVRITKIGISGTQTTGMLQDLLLIKRSSAPVGGTSTTPAIVSYDSNSAAGTAVARAYTSNPTTLGTSIGIIKVAKLLINQVSGGPGGPSSPQDIVWTFGAGPSQALVLRGIAQQISINYNGQTSAGSSFDLFVEWTEE